MFWIVHNYCLQFSAGSPEDVACLAPMYSPALSAWRTRRCFPVWFLTYINYSCIARSTWLLFCVITNANLDPTSVTFMKYLFPFVPSVRSGPLTSVHNISPGASSCLTMSCRCRLSFPLLPEENEIDTSGCAHQYGIIFFAWGPAPQPGSHDLSPSAFHVHGTYSMCSCAVLCPLSCWSHVDCQAMFTL